ncbi:MAG: AMP-binding protein [Bryobacteraceae bacterium]
MTLSHLFDLSLLARRDVPALEWQGQTWTFGEIDARSNRLAHLFLHLGLAAGDRLCVYLANCPALIDIYLACVKTGIIFVPINILYREREIVHIVGDAEPRLIVTRAEMPALSAPLHTPEDLVLQAENMPAGRPPGPIDGDTPAALVYTSGTTGVSKGAILTHNNLAANAINLAVCWQITHQDRMLLGLPLFHVHALGNGLHTWLAAGYRMRLLERFEHRRAAAEFEQFQPTLFFGVPTVYVRLLDTPPAAAARMAARMRLFVSGSAPLPPQVLDDFRDLFGHTILERYGMTETLMNISNPYAGERRPGTVGFPLPGISMRIVNAQGTEVTTGEQGEIELRGPNVFAGYWRRPDATEAAFRNGWFRTGDVASRAADGYVTLHGRKSDLIISGGFNIYPREIEEFLLEQDGVAEAAVVGVPDSLRGEVPVAYLVTPDPLDEHRLEQACRASLASFKVPRAFIRVDALPRTALGKVQKHLLPPPGKS